MAGRVEGAAVEATAGGDEALRARPFASRLRLYLAERFPLGPYALLIGSLTLACQAAAQASRGGGVDLSLRSLAAFATVLLVFLHLRIMDESKDYEDDRAAHPERIVSRGIVALGELSAVLAAVIAAEVAINAAIGGRALAFYLACLAFTILMRFEFFAGRLLRREPLAYAATHHPIVQLLGAYVAEANGAPFPWPLVPLLLGTGLGFEVARNIRSPDEDAANPREATYSKRLGARGAAILAAGLGAIALAGFLRLSRDLDLSPLAIAAGAAGGAPLAVAAARFARRPAQAGAKRIETAAQVQTLALYLALAGGVAAARGVSIGGAP